MRPIGGGCGAGEAHCYPSARRLLLGVAPSAAALPASSPSLDAQRARLATALCATTAVLFVASVSYIAVSTLFACLRAAGRPRQPPNAKPQAMMETKRALDEIPVVVVQAPPCGSDEAAGGGECAVCLADYAGGEEVRVLPACRHGFHRECVDRWLLTRAPTCPVCRAPVVAARAEGRDAAKGCTTGNADAGPGLPVVGDSDHLGF